MNLTEAYRLVLDAAKRFELGYSIMDATPKAKRQLSAAIAKIRPRVERMESRLQRFRERNAKNPNRPKCLQ